MDETVPKDADEDRYSWVITNQNLIRSVHKVERAIFKAYLDQTDDFRSSIFENKNSVYY